MGADRTRTTAHIGEVTLSVHLCALLLGFCYTLPVTGSKGPPEKFHSGKPCQDSLWVNDSKLNIELADSNRQLLKAAQHKAHAYLWLETTLIETTRKDASNSILLMISNISNIDCNTTINY